MFIKIFFHKFIIIPFDFLARIVWIITPLQFFSKTCPLNYYKRVTTPFANRNDVIIWNMVYVVGGFDSQSAVTEDDSKEDTIWFIPLREKPVFQEEEKARKKRNKRWKWKLFFCLAFQGKCRNSSSSHRIPSYFTRLDLFPVKAQGCVPPRRIPFHPPASFIRIFGFEFLIYLRATTSNLAAIFTSRRPKWRKGAQWSVIEIQLSKNGTEWRFVFSKLSGPVLNFLFDLSFVLFYVYT